MRSRFAPAVLLTIAILAASPVGADTLSDPGQAQAANKCQIIVERTGADVAVEALDALSNCVGPIIKCVETKPGDAGCLDKARQRCEDQLDIAKVQANRMFDAIARKCSSDLSVESMLDPLGLDFESLKAECKKDFGVELTDAASIGQCLALQHSCEIERMFAFEMPRAS